MVRGVPLSSQNAEADTQMTMKLAMWKSEVRDSKTSKTDLVFARIQRKATMVEV